MVSMRLEVSCFVVGFNGAMAVRPWMDGGGRPCTARGACFNGAMAVRPWMAAPPPHPPGGLPASMGPWP